MNAGQIKSLVSEIDCAYSQDRGLICNDVGRLQGMFSSFLQHLLTIEPGWPRHKGVGGRGSTQLSSALSTCGASSQFDLCRLMRNMCRFPS